MPPKKKNRNLDAWEDDFKALDENGELVEPTEAQAPGEQERMLYVFVINGKQCGYLVLWWSASRGCVVCRRLVSAGALDFCCLPRSHKGEQGCLHRVRGDSGLVPLPFSGQA